MGCSRSWRSWKWPVSFYIGQRELGSLTCFFALSSFLYKLNECPCLETVCEGGAETERHWTSHWWSERTGQLTSPYGPQTTQLYSIPLSRTHSYHRKLCLLFLSSQLYSYKAPFCLRMALSSRDKGPGSHSPSCWFVQDSSALFCSSEMREKGCGSQTPHFLCQCHPCRALLSSSVLCLLRFLILPVLWVSQLPTPSPPPCCLLPQTLDSPMAPVLYLFLNLSGSAEAGPSLLLTLTVMFVAQQHLPFRS